MKHQKEIYGQRLVNMKQGVNSSLVHLTNLQTYINGQLNKNPDNFKDTINFLVDEVEEIKEFLEWVKEQ